MAEAQGNRGSSNPENAKLGSEPVHVDRPRDFGISPDQTNEVKYASHAALNQDKGRMQDRSNDERDGRRDVGVGVNSGGTGAGSGGDVDLDIVGVGTGGSGVSQAPVRKRDELQQHLATGRVDRDRPATTSPDGADTSEASSRDVIGSELEDQGHTGADAIRTDAENDPFQDATMGEISSDESNGTDSDEGVELNDDNA